MTLLLLGLTLGGLAVAVWLIYLEIKADREMMEWIEQNMYQPPDEHWTRRRD